MSDLVKQLLELINIGATINEISEILGLTNKQIYNLITIIKNNGYDFERKYYSTGDIIYLPKKRFYLPEETDRGVTLITTPQEKEITILIMSDPHIGSEYERLDLIEKAFTYCIDNNIHIIIIGGDFIDGMVGPYGRKHKTNEEQIKYAIKKYPFDKNIITFTVLGNHDYKSLKENGQDFSLILKSYRHDIVPLGYGVGQLNIKNDKIIVLHPLKSNQQVEKFSGARTVIIRGHSHKTRIKILNQSNTIIAYISSISDRVFSENEIMPGAMLATLRFYNGYISTITFKQLMLGEKVYTVNEFNYPLGYSRKIVESQKIKNEEKPPKRLILEKHQQ